MQQLLEKNKENRMITNKSQLMQIFFSGIKKKTDFKIGLEFEKLGIDNKKFIAKPFLGENGIFEFLNKFKKEQSLSSQNSGEYVNNINYKDGIITIEPGSQVEYSINPRKTIKELNKIVINYNKVTNQLAEDMGIKWIGLGNQPVSTYKDIIIIPKDRYKIMTEYLPAKGSRPFVMMRETAGIQAAFDFNSEKDAMNKLRLSVGLSPIITAMFANSPIREGKFSGFKSYRAYGWLDTDEDRCGLISPELFKNDFSFEAYTDIMLNLPMIFLNKEGKWFNMKGMPFREYLKNGYKDYHATIEDWHLHLSSFFPDVRLKNYIEVRCTDCQRENLIPAVPALWKGLLYNQNALEAAWDLIKNLDWKDYAGLRLSVPKLGLEAKCRYFKVADVAKELVNIAILSLKEQQNSNGLDESIYLEELSELVGQGKSPADILIKNWNGSWSRDISRLINYSSL